MCQGKITGNWTQEKYKESMLETGDIGDDSTMIGNMIITDIMPSNPVQVSAILGTCYFDDYSLFLPSTALLHSQSRWQTGGAGTANNGIKDILFSLRSYAIWI